MGRSRRKHQVPQATTTAQPPASSNSPSSALTTRLWTRLPFTLDEALAKPQECRSKITPYVYEDQFARIYDHGKMIARMYRDIAEALLADHYLGGSFEGWWKNKISEEDRKNFLLLGIVEANSRTGGMVEIHRLLRPDISLSELAAGNGEGFIALLRQIVQSAQTFEKQQDYYPIISPEFDKYYRIDRQHQSESLPLDRGARVYQSIRQHDRHYFISVFALSVLKNSCFAKSAVIDGALLKKERIKLDRPISRGSPIVDRGKAQSHTQLESIPPPEPLVPGLPGWFSATPELFESIHSALIDACRCCRRVAQEVPELRNAGKVGKLLMCAQCFSLNPPHRFFYCSTECQKYDYKYGGHKEICGKLFTDLALTPAGWKQPPSLPPLPISLQYQIYHLKREFTGSSPYRLYHVRYYIDGPPHPKGPDYTPLAWNKRCYCIATGRSTDYNTVRDTFLRAIDTRDEESIRIWITTLFNNLPVNPDVSKDFVCQCAEDWDLSESKIQEWVKGTKDGSDVAGWFLEAGERMCKYKGRRRTTSVDDFSFNDHLYKIGYRRLVDRTIDRDRRARSALPHRR
ncbi:hypothetical protein JCM3765_005152 [Sporobolomyces pararoseus]